MAYKPIGEYGLIGDKKSAALVGTDGSIDWCCFPRFDSPSVFGAILDDRRGGRFQIAPASPYTTREQSYLADTNVLSTSFTTESGEMSVLDFMPVREAASEEAGPSEIHRVVRCTRGTVSVKCTFEPRLDYARASTALKREGQAIVANGGRQTLRLSTQVPMDIESDRATGEISLVEGEKAVFVAAYGYDRPTRIESYRTSEKLAATLTYWRSLVNELSCDGRWKAEIVRSFLLLQILRYEASGAIVAAPTASLPERNGGSRTWDYRYSWLRDSSFTMDAFYRMGWTGGASKYINWLVDHCKVTNGNTRIVYGVSRNSSLKESVLDHLDGYMGSRPVRIGNGAANHLQTDVFGEVILAIDTLQRRGGEVPEDAWSVVEHFADTVCNTWTHKDRGVWEVRGEQRHFVYSKIMCWVALDRAVMLAKALRRPAPIEKWEQCARTIKAEVLQQGWSDRKGSFVQSYGSETLDASSLVIPFVGFLPPGDRRVASTVEAISRELADGPLVQRYIPEQTDDGLNAEPEGAFTMLSFWLIGNLIQIGQVERAREYFERVLDYSNHLGLFAEMIDRTTLEPVGNFPQAYSHIGLIHTAGNLERALSSNGAA